MNSRKSAYNYSLHPTRGADAPLAGELNRYVTKTQ
jgi:hypothetical protein